MEQFMVREAATPEDMWHLLALYTHLHQNPMPEPGPELDTLWSRMVRDPDHYILLGFSGDVLVSSCVLLIVPNLTWGQRPYALVENVVTHAEYRGQGFGRRVMEQAREMAQARHCYKIALMTGSKGESVLGFYGSLGYNQQDKTAFVRWLPE